MSTYQVNFNVKIQNLKFWQSWSICTQNHYRYRPFQHTSHAGAHMRFQTYLIQATHQNNPVTKTLSQFTLAHHPFIIIQHLQSVFMYTIWYPCPCFTEFSFYGIQWLSENQSHILSQSMEEVRCIFVSDATACKGWCPALGTRQESCSLLDEGQTTPQ